MIIQLDESYLDEAYSIVEDAKRLLKESGSTQWQSGYPYRETLLEDITKRRLYGYIDKGSLIAIMALVKGDNPDYQVIYEGSWINEPGEGDIVVHRIAVKANSHLKGIGLEMVEFAKEKGRVEGCRSLKIDTHRLNIPMQKISLKAGLSYRGIIYLVRSDEKDNARLVYECSL